MESKDSESKAEEGHKHGGEDGYCVQPVLKAECKGSESKDEGDGDGEAEEEIIMSMIEFMEDVDTSELEDFEMQCAATFKDTEAGEGYTFEHEDMHRRMVQLLEEKLEGFLAAEGLNGERRTIATHNRIDRNTTGLLRCCATSAQKLLGIVNRAKASGGSGSWQAEGQ